MSAENAPQAVIHLATAYGYDGNFVDVIESNILMPSRLLNLCGASGCNHFINTDTFFAKSAFEYPHLKEYIQSKRDFINWANMACRANPKLRFSSMRLEHVYGEGDRPKKFVPDLISRLQKNQLEIPLTLGNQKRDFIHVNDVAMAYACVLKNEGELAFGITEYEVGTGFGITLRSFVETARNVTRSSSLLCFGALPHRDGEIMSSIANPHQLIELGWQPQTSLIDGLHRTVSANHDSAIYKS
jgi:nucleoside-diphosphate-sugar epimerase